MNFLFPRGCGYDYAHPRVYARRERFGRVNPPRGDECDCVRCS